MSEDNPAVAPATCMGRKPSPAGALDSYRIGTRVRRLRLRKKISLEELGRHTSLSPALLSKLERDLVTPTLPTLLRIAAVFGIGLEDFFVRELPQASVVRSNERLRFPEVPDADNIAFHFEVLNFNATARPINAYLAHFHPSANGLRLHAHDAAEFLYVLSGALLVHVDGLDHQLDAGDSIHINGGAAHGYARQGEVPCKAVVITTAHPAAAAPLTVNKPVSGNGSSGG
jgi:transcriptional regulator with XRE-family HTH domain